MSFDRRGPDLACEGVPLARIAEEVGTPCYVYSRAALRSAMEAFERALAATGVPHLICFSLKANSCRAVLREFARAGAGADVVSEGELLRALDAGIDPARIVFSGVGKQPSEIEAALGAGIRMLNVESEPELGLIEEIAGRLGRRAPIAVRVNPNVDPKTHPYIATGLKDHKFGVPFDEARALYARARRSPWLEPVGIDCHIGSQITETQPFEDALRSVGAWAIALRGEGTAISRIDVGGGLGVAYDPAERPPPTAEAYVRSVVAALGPALDGRTELILEPGRALVAQAGVLLCRVLLTKDGGRRRFVIVDGSMTELLRPALYDAYHRIEPVGAPRPGRRVVDVVGPVCESGDFLALGRDLPELEAGDLVAVHAAGAYGYAMASNYNERPKPPEVLVAGDRWAIVRAREDLRAAWQLESFPDWED